MAKIEDLEDFEETEENREYDEKTDQTKRYITIGVIAVLSIALGIVVFIVSDNILNSTKKKPDDGYIGEQLPLTDENVQILYQYVTYGTEGTRNPKFAKEANVSISSFTDEEKLYYALQFVQVEDFEFTGEMTQDKKHKIYNIPLQKIDNYMKLYFGPNVKAQPVKSLKYPFTFFINKMNVGDLSFNQERNGYDATFTTSKDMTTKEPVEPVYGQLISAVQRQDGSVVLQERVVYTEMRTDDGGYAVNIYKDPEKKQLLETKNGLNDETLKSFTVNPNAYQSTAIIEYTFAVYNTTLYFQSSRIVI